MEISLRKTSEVQDVVFPYRKGTVTLIRIARNPLLDNIKIEQAKGLTAKLKLLRYAKPSDIILAAWPGEFTQDIFLVDDIPFAKKVLRMSGKRYAEWVIEEKRRD